MNRGFAKCYLLALVGLLALDGIWLGCVGWPFYRSQIGFLLSESPNWAAAGVFYLLFTAGLVVFVISPSLRGGSVSLAVLRGGFFGLLCYATYDLTNLATVKGWPLLVTVVDLVWGTVLTAAITLFSVWLGRKWV
jgi:uncharacterized membrane protein